VCTAWSHLRGLQHQIALAQECFSQVNQTLFFTAISNESQSAFPVTEGAAPAIHTSESQSGRYS
jgi:hypothetical protein